MKRECTAEDVARVDARWEQVCALEKRFSQVFGEQEDERAAREAREIEMDGDLAAIPVAHRRAVARQLIIALDQHGFIDHSVDDAQDHWRVIAVRLGLPYLEVFHAVEAATWRGDTTRNDLDEWLAWAREHAPERLAVKGGA